MLLWRFYLENILFEEWRLLGCYADVSEEFSAPIIRMTRIGELGTLAVN
jgi:hypothetical protein